MYIQEIFDLAIQLENKMSECYKEISQFCRDESFSDELMKLSQEEKYHMTLLANGKSYITDIPEEFNLKSIQETDMKDGLNRIIRLIGKIKNKEASLAEVLNDMIELERLFEQFHLKTVAEAEDSSLKQLFEILSQGDHTHRERLVRIFTGLKTSSLELL